MVYYITQAWHLQGTPLLKLFKVYVLVRIYYMYLKLIRIL